MKEQTGKIFNIPQDNKPVKNHTISKIVHTGTNNLCYFSLDRNTDISAEIFPYYKMIYVVYEK